MSAQAVACSYCAAISFGAPPHGEGQSCPLKLRVDEAYVAKLDAERMALIKGNVQFEALAAMLRKLHPDDDDDSE